MPIPICPSCDLELTEIATSDTVWIVWKDGKWVREIRQSDPGDLPQCPVCLEELTAEDLDKLDVPNRFRYK
jgi:hypothetical protein